MYLKAIASLTSIEYCLSICISNVLMTTMGRLAVELNQSIIENFKEKRQVTSCFFCSKCSYKVKQGFVITVSAFYYAAVIALFIIQCMRIAAIGGVRDWDKAQISYFLGNDE